jgi:hypothetical protein
MAAIREDIETRLKWLEACEGIRSAIYSYAMAGDRGNDAAIVRRLFTEDGIFEAKGMGRFEGLENIVSGLEAIARDVVVWSFHAPSGPLIKLTEDVVAAEVFWWVWVPVSMKNELDEITPHWGAAHYNAEMVDSGGQWKFKRVLMETRLRTPFNGPWTAIEGPFQWLI